MSWKPSRKSREKVGRDGKSHGRKIFAGCNLERVMIKNRKPVKATRVGSVASLSCTMVTALPRDRMALGSSGAWLAVSG